MPSCGQLISKDESVQDKAAKHLNFSFYPPPEGWTTNYSYQAIRNCYSQFI